MGYDNNITDSNVEDRIAGEFMHRLHNADVTFELAELIEEQSGKNGFGGSEELVERIESELIENAD